jgi:hypothetical protein
MASVRTRGDLADLINSTADPIAVKQEFTGPEVEEMDLDGCTDVEMARRMRAYWKNRRSMRST